MSGTCGKTRGPRSRASRPGTRAPSPAPGTAFHGLRVSIGSWRLLIADHGAAGTAASPSRNLTNSSGARASSGTARARLLRGASSDQLQPLLESEGNGFALGVDFELVQDVLDVVPGREVRDMEGDGDLGGRAAGPEHPQHLDLARGKPARADVRRLPRARERGRRRSRTVRILEGGKLDSLRPEDMREKKVARRARPEIQNRDVHGDDMAVAALELETEVVHALPPGRYCGDRATLRAVTVPEGVATLETRGAQLPDDVGGREPEDPLGALIPEDDPVVAVGDEDGIGGKRQRAEDGGHLPVGGARPHVETLYALASSVLMRVPISG